MIVQCLLSIWVRQISIKIDYLNTCLISIGGTHSNELYLMFSHKNTKSFAVSESHQSFEHATGFMDFICKRRLLKIADK